MTREPVLVEACVTSTEEAIGCFDVGAGRVELCRALDVGGLTPKTEEVTATLSAAPGPTNVLARPRADTFQLDPEERRDLLEKVASLAALGADGVVVGVLDDARRADRAAMEELVSATGEVPVTFHRAFDRVDAPLRGVEALVEAGVSRVLTSGGAATAWEGRGTLRELVERSGEDLTVIGGGRVRSDHVRPLVEETGLREVHARASAVPEIVETIRP
ncbi:MAG: copper homeostasis protein CutC [Salinibacter sp.]